ncbi:MAG: hypothetical protein WC327_07620 [Candidatus Cloacimonadia bacterium]
MNHLIFFEKSSAKLLNISEIIDLIRPVSELGRRYKHSLKPYLPGQEAELRSEYSRIKILLDKIQSDKSFIASLTASIAKIDNIRYSLTKAIADEALELQDIYEVKHFVFYSEKVRSILVEKGLTKITNLPDFSNLFSYLDPERQNIPLFHISGKYSKLLHELKSDYSQLNLKLESLAGKNLERAKEGLNLKGGGDQIVVSRNNKALIDKLSDSKWFTLSSENFANLTFILKKSEEELRLEKEKSDLKASIEEEELRVRSEISKKISVRAQELIDTHSLIANLDFLIAKTIFAIETKGIIPNVIEKSGANQELFSIVKGVNIPVKRQLKIKNIEYQPIDICIRKNINLITGANMAGKSTTLKTIGQLFYLLAFGAPLPCSEASLPLVDFIFLSNDTESTNRMDLSSFASELISIDRAIKNKGYGLFLIDEFARGTNPQEGEAFAKATIERFINKNALVISSTHFTAPTLIKEAGHFRIKGLSENSYETLKETLHPQSNLNNSGLQIRLQELHKYMDYRIEEVENSTVPPKAALMIAEILGVEKEILQKVKEYIESNGNK